ncbi:hypothetical protein SGRIM119S_01031 [Streptomyces griseorubiginosus]
MTGQGLPVVVAGQSLPVVVSGACPRGCSGRARGDGPGPTHGDVPGACSSYGRPPFAWSRTARRTVVDLPGWWRGTCPALGRQLAWLVGADPRARGRGLAQPVVAKPPARRQPVRPVVVDSPSLWPAIRQPSTARGRALTQALAATPPGPGCQPAQPGGRQPTRPPVPEAPRRTGRGARPPPRESPGAWLQKAAPALLAVCRCAGGCIGARRCETGRKSLFGCAVLTHCVRLITLVSAIRREGTPRASVTEVLDESGS